MALHALHQEVEDAISDLTTAIADAVETQHTQDAEDFAPLPNGVFPGYVATVASDGNSIIYGPLPGIASIIDRGNGTGVLVPTAPTEVDDNGDGTGVIIIET